MSLIISRQQQIHLMTGRVFSFPLPDADFLSLLSNDEVNAVVLSREFAVEMEKVFAVDLANSRQIQRDE